MSSNLRTFVVVNMNAGGGMVEREWDQIERRLKNTLPEHDFAFTNGPEHATLLTREALRAGWEMIVSIGGDGTLNEVVNGFFEKEAVDDYFSMEPGGWITNAHKKAPQPINPDAVLGIIPMGTGGDFRRSVGLTLGWKDALERLQGTMSMPMDVGQCAYINHSGSLDHRYFINISSAGISGLVDDLVNRTSKRLGGKLSFIVGVLRAFAQWRNVALDLRIDDVEEVTQKINTCAMANGQFFGGGMRLAPAASVSDGALELVVMGDLNTMESIDSFKAIYNGTHLDKKKVWTKTVRHVAARSTDAKIPVLIDLDGEQPGQLPVFWKIHPSIIKFKIQTPS